MQKMIDFLCIGFEKLRFWTYYIYLQFKVDIFIYYIKCELGGKSERSISKQIDTQKDKFCMSSRIRKPYLILRIRYKLKFAKAEQHFFFHLTVDYPKISREKWSNLFSKRYTDHLINLSISIWSTTNDRMNSAWRLTKKPEVTKVRLVDVKCCSWMLQFSNYHLLILKIPSLKDEIDTRSPQQKKAMKVFYELPS